ncbi:MAG: hypothetical protein HY722_08655 [Planctomycetes bacterium]|nr:hypothetical protein [Planctomycetota bacterium]
MARKARRRRVEARSGQPFLAAYQTAFAQVAYEEAYEALREDPRRIEIIRRAMRELAATFTPADEGPRR